MNRYLIGAVGILGLLLTIFFFMWRNTSLQNRELRTQISTITATLDSTKNALQEKMAALSQQNQKYQTLLSSIKYNECEDQPVSETLLKAAKELQQ